ncbi:MAG TPA: patatin-like protein [Actinomycetales bacterium]|nr:patatin-like protein [Actinomycetales bacterium]
MTPDDPATSPLPRTVTELRLALVCYGGVSLAIYMHGVVKELQKLVVASRRFDELGPAAANPFDAATDTEHAYFETLGDLARANHHLSVTIDIVAGTSAGGINGVCLAKVLARNGSQAALKKLWIDEGDLKKLLKGPPIGGWRLRAAVAGLLTLVRLSKPVSPLRGDRMSRLLYDAIADMEAPVDDRRSLLLPATPLDLFVTTTDLDGYQLLVASGAGGASQRETDHAQVVQFRSSVSGATTADDDLGPGATGALAFAARATSSFPGAFPPVSLSSFARELQGRSVDLDAVARRFRHRYDTAPPTSAAAPAGDVRGPWFVDGGVLDNAPFDLVVQAIGAKRAQNEVVRRLLYIQPDPGIPLDAQAATSESTGGDYPGAVPTGTPEPGYLSALVTSVLGVKGSHSILRDLVALRDLNVRIAEVGAIAELQMVQVMHAIDAAWDAATSQVGAADADHPLPQTAWSIDDPQDVRRLSDALYASAPQLTGAGFSTYCRLKVDVAGERLAEEIATRFVYPPGSSRSSFVRAAIGAWARGHVEWSDPDPTRLMELLGPVDVPYRERRMLFVLAGVNALYPLVDEPAAGTGLRPRRSELDALKATAWQLLEDLKAAPRDAVAAVPDELVAFLGGDLTDEGTLGSAEEFGAAHDADFTRLFGAYRESLANQLGDGSGPVWQAFVDHTSTWPDDLRRALASRYLGFPLWDALIFPTVAFAQLPQFSPIATHQLSPLAATALPTPAGGKLKGVSLHHFGGFVDATWRENDYLWGRLDGAELVLRLLRTSVGEHDDGGRWLKGALGAVLADEGDLTRIATLRRRLAEDVARLP